MEPIFTAHTWLKNSYRQGHDNPTDDLVADPTSHKHGCELCPHKELLFLLCKACPKRRYSCLEWNPNLRSHHCSGSGVQNRLHFRRNGHFDQVFMY